LQVSVVSVELVELQQLELVVVTSVTVVAMEGQLTIAQALQMLPVVVGLEDILETAAPADLSTLLALRVLAVAAVAVEPAVAALLQELVGVLG
jgi:hypothetical protein